MSLSYFPRLDPSNEAAHPHRGGVGTAVIALGGWVLDGTGTTLIVLGRRVRDGVDYWRRRRHAIHELTNLDDRMLRDIGLLRADIPSVVETLLSTSRSDGPIAKTVFRADAPPRKPAVARDGRRIDPSGAVAKVPVGCG